MGNDKKTGRRGSIERRVSTYVLFSVTWFLRHSTMVKIAGFYPFLFIKFFLSANLYMVVAFALQ